MTVLQPRHVPLIDMILCSHVHWVVLLRDLRFRLTDECHYYREVFCSKVAAVLRCLLRLCDHYSTAPMVILVSATADSSNS